MGCSPSLSELLLLNLPTHARSPQSHRPPPRMADCRVHGSPYGTWTQRRWYSSRRPGASRRWQPLSYYRRRVNSASSFRAVRLPQVADHARTECADITSTGSGIQSAAAAGAGRRPGWPRGAGGTDGATVGFNLTVTTAGGEGPRRRRSSKGKQPRRVPADRADRHGRVAISMQPRSSYGRRRRIQKLVIRCSGR